MDSETANFIPVTQFGEVYTGVNMSGLWPISIFLLFIVALCVIEKAYILAFMFGWLACDIAFTASEIDKKHYSEKQIEVIKREAVEEYKRNLTQE